MRGEIEKSYSIKSVENALNLLEALVETDGDVRIARLSERLGMNKSIIFRLLATFEQKGYVEKSGKSGKYRLGLWSYEMGRKILSRMSVLNKAKPIMERLARQCDEAVYLAVRREEEVLLLDMVDTSHQVAIKSLVGNSYPMASTSAGRVFLASDSVHGDGGKEESLTFFGHDQAFIRHQGGCVEVGGFGAGVVSLAVPLLDAESDLSGCLCLMGPEFRFSDERIKSELFPELQEAGQVVSSKLGYFGSRMV